MKSVISPVRFLTLLVLGLASQGAWAYCVSNTIYNNVSLAGIKVPRDRPMGLIGNPITIASSNSASVNCSGTMQLMLKLGTTMKESAIPGVFETNVPGIGIKVWETTFKTFNITNGLTYWYTHSASSAAAWLVGVQMQFYVTGPISPGEVVLPSPMVEAWANTDVSGNGAARYVVIQVPNPIKIEAMACETPDMVVPMGDHKGTEFTGKGATSHTVPFNFELKNCAAGLSSVSYRFEPAAGIKLVGSGNGQYLTLNSTSTAKHVGLQVMYENGTMVPFGTKIKYTGYNKATAKSYVIPMKARYIQTDNIIIGGTANTALEFTMMYE